MAMASGAAGADQVFLETALSLGWPIRLVLPVAAYLFEQDFTSHDAAGDAVIDASGLERFRRLRAAALEEEIIAPSPERHVAFTCCANTLIAEADVLVALWDGQPGKQGGTNESLLLATQLKVPLVTLDAGTGKPIPGWPIPEPSLLSRRYARRHAPGTILDDIDIAISRSLSPAEHASFAALPVVEQHAKYGRLLADQSESLARSYKRKNLWAVGLHAGASFIGLFALLFLVLAKKFGLKWPIILSITVGQSFRHYC
ncbi:MAG: hypothetical protein WC661_01890 [Opitutaceae bacterium]